MPQETDRLKLPLPLGNENVTRESINGIFEKIDAGVATQADLETLREAVSQMDIPDASLTQKGKVQLSSKTDGTSETLAATEKAVKQAYDLASRKLDANIASIELRNGSTTAGSAYIDFHSGATPVDFDSRIIADGGNGNSQGGNLNLQAAMIWLNAVQTLVDKLWVARNTAYGSSSNLSLAIGDSDTGFNWLGDGYLDFFSNSQVPVRLIGGGFEFKNSSGNYENLRQVIDALRSRHIISSAAPSGGNDGDIWYQYS